MKPIVCTFSYLIFEHFSVASAPMSFSDVLSSLFEGSMSRNVDLCFGLFSIQCIHFFNNLFHYSSRLMTDTQKK